MLANKEVVLALEPTTRVAIEQSPRVKGIAKELYSGEFIKSASGRFVKVAYFNYTGKDLDKTGKVTKAVTREAKAIGSALTALGITKRNTDPKKNWKNVRVTSKAFEIEGKVRHVFTMSYLPPVTAKAKATKAKATKAEVIAPIVAPIVS